MNGLHIAAVRIPALLLALAVAPAGLAATPEEAADQALTLGETARSICQASTDPARPAPLEVEQAVDEAVRAIEAAVVSEETLPAAEPVFAALAERIGDLDQVPSLRLQSLRNTLVQSAGDDDQRLTRGRALVLALMLHIARSGNGNSPETAWHPCLIGNEYHFVRQVLQARVDKQALVHEGDGVYDRLTVIDAKGLKRDVFFDVTAIFNRNAAYLRP